SPLLHLSRVTSHSRPVRNTRTETHAKTLKENPDSDVFYAVTCGDSALTERDVTIEKLSFEVFAQNHFDQQHAGKQRHPNHHPSGVKNVGVLAHRTKDQREEHKGDRGEGTHPGGRARSHP